MVTYVKVVVWLLMVFGGTSPLWVNPQWAEPLAAPGAAELNVPDAEEEIDTSRLIVVVETDKFRLFYPVSFAEVISLEDILSRVNAAFARVEKEFGAFEKRVDIYVPGRIQIPGAEENGLVVAGLTFVRDRQVNVLVALWAAKDVDTFAHELLHARLRDAGISPPGWFEEGLAHFMETKDGFNEELYELLLKKGPIGLDKAAEIDGITEDEMQLRATAWLLTYYLHTFEGKTLREIAEAESLPDPSKALEAVTTAHEANEALMFEIP